ncbi:glycoprotease [Obba rivulosa]|uniref:N(6)-L-threonylcarbamoyladenine synthase n=1 Tax=Obba rivulosa TaxID=1052685 RepID=A0A8E2B2T9_9APHY|nr:glycoprotease [Obba rivulosa]
MYGAVLRSPRHQLRRVTCCQSWTSRRGFSVLGIETSADDTCAAIVTSDRKILSNVVQSQHSYHEEYRGIHPYMAIEAHQRHLPGVVRQALKEANMSIQDLDGIAFTRGPGIAGCLSVGSNAAKTLAGALNKPLIGVHHMQAHALTVFLTSPPEEAPQFPFLSLLLSGGHSLLLVAVSPTNFRILATTADQSIGTAFDHVAKMLEIPWMAAGPGASLEQFAKTEVGDVDSDDLPYDNIFVTPMPGKLAFSFSAPESQAARLVEKRGVRNMSLKSRVLLARAFQTRVVLQLEQKLAIAIKHCREEQIPIRHLVVSGGVASNAFLRERLRVCLDSASTDDRISLVCPPPKFCTDNAAMIAWASMDRFLSGDTDEYSVEHKSRWSLDEFSASTRSKELQPHAWQP